MKLDLHYDSYRDVLTVEGIQYSGELFRILGFPRTDRFYQFRRDGQTVIVTDRGPATELLDLFRALVHLVRNAAQRIAPKLHLCVHPAPIANGVVITSADAVAPEDVERLRRALEIGLKGGAR